MHIKQTHISTAQPNLLKEHVSPAHGKPVEIKHENTTINIGHLADSGKLEMSTCNKIYSGLIVWSLEMPNAPYSQRWRSLRKKLV